MEGLSDESKSYLPITPPSDNCTNAPDSTIPPFSNASSTSKALLLVYLDRDRPLSEPKWVKSGDVQEWLKSIFGRMFWVAGDAADGWERRIEIVDPDPVRALRVFIISSIDECLADAHNMDRSRRVGNKLTSR
jgi:20S proteasome subunit alpha 6